MSENKIILALEKGNKGALKQFYLDNKEPFMKYAYRFSLSEHELFDVYQDATIVLFEKAMEGKLNQLKCSLKTYLFSIGKYMIYEQLRKKNKTTLLNTDTIKDDYYEIIDYDNEPLSSEQIQLKNAFKLLGKKCNEILTLFYYKGYTLDEITLALNYDKKDVLKSQKSRCLSNLKKLTKK